jgi:hypothetical protein
MKDCEACGGTGWDPIGDHGQINCRSCNPLDIHPEQIAMAGGKAASSKIPRFDYIPTIALEMTAARFELGVARKGDKAWNALSNNQEVLTDKEFLIERCAHIIHHALKLRDKLQANDLEGMSKDDDASAIVWGGMFLQCATNALKGEPDVEI